MADQVCTADDAQLVADIQNGLTQAETVLYEKYAARVYYVALKESRSPQDAEDVQTETFLRVLQAVRGKQIRAPAALSGFILGTTRNVLHELFTSRQRAEDPAADADTPDLPTPSHEKLFLDAEVRQAIQVTIVTLRPRERDLLRMVFYEELTPEEIARRSGIARERVRLVKSRALKHFREVYRRLQRTSAPKYFDTNRRQRVTL